MANRILVYTSLLFLFASCQTSDDVTDPLSEKENFYPDLFFSEYVEGISYNKALEIANFTGAPIELGSAGYSIKKQSNGSGNWIGELVLTGVIAHNDVFVIGNEASINPGIISNSNQTKTGAPMDFNGNDPVGLFKNGVLVDIIGSFNDSNEFAKDMTLRRKKDLVAPVDNFNVENWERFEVDNTEDLGKY